MSLTSRELKIPSLSVMRDKRCPKTMVMLIWSIDALSCPCATCEKRRSICTRASPRVLFRSPRHVFRNARMAHGHSGARRIPCVCYDARVCATDQLYTLGTSLAQATCVPLSNEWGSLRHRELLIFSHQCAAAVPSSTSTIVRCAVLTWAASNACVPTSAATLPRRPLLRPPLYHFSYDKP